MFCQYNKLHQAVKSRVFNENKEAKVLLALTEEKDKGIDSYDAGHAKKDPNESPSEDICA